MEQFLRKFQFQQDKAWYIGIERENFILDESGIIQPYAGRLIPAINDQMVGYELSACQIEFRLDPVTKQTLRQHVQETNDRIRRYETQHRFKCGLMEVAPTSLPLDVYPDPTGRYQDIASKLPPETLSAACRVAGTHIHIGMPDFETAIQVHDHVIQYVDRLIDKGDNSDGKRMNLYKVVVPDPYPVRFGSCAGFYSQATKHGWLEDPRQCWSLVRISTHGTIEFRMFGVAENNEVLLSWAKQCYSHCREAIEVAI